MKRSRIVSAGLLLALAAGLALMGSSCSLMPAPKVRIRLSEFRKNVETAYYSFGYRCEILEGASDYATAKVYFDGIADDGHVYSAIDTVFLDMSDHGEEVAFYCNGLFDVKDVVPMRAVISPSVSLNSWEVLFERQEDGSYIASTY